MLVYRVREGEYSPLPNSLSQRWPFYLAVNVMPVTLGSFSLPYVLWALPLNFSCNCRRHNTEHRSKFSFKMGLFDVEGGMNWKVLWLPSMWCCKSAGWCVALRAAAAVDKQENEAKEKWMRITLIPSFPRLLGQYFSHFWKKHQEKKNLITRNPRLYGLCSGGATFPDIVGCMSRF